MTTSETPSQRALDEAQAKAANASAEYSRQQALQLAQQTSDSQYSALVPDLTKVTAGSLGTSNDKVGMASTLAFGAMNDAAGLVVEAMQEIVTGGSAIRLLLTSKPDLVSGMSSRLDVAAELEELTKAASALLAPPKEDQHVRSLVFGSAVAAAASLIPGVLSLFAKHETLSSGAVASNDLAAVAAMAGALLELDPAPMLIHDTFQLSSRGPLYDQADQLATKLAQLEALTGPDAAKAKSLISVVTNTLTSITAVPKGGSVSALAAANVWERLTSGPNPITHVLLVTSEAGSTTQLFDQRVLLQDKVLLAATAGITYMLIDMESAIRAGGTASATLQLRGKVDEVLKKEIILMGPEDRQE